MNVHRISNRLRLDRLGIALSGLCAAHCVASIVLVTALGLGGWLLSPAIHEIGLVLAVVIGALTVGIGVLNHGKWWPLTVGGAGVALMAIAIAVPHGVGEAALTIAGVLFVASAHVLNLRLHAL